MQLLWPQTEFEFERQSRSGERQIRFRFFWPNPNFVVVIVELERTRFASSSSYSKQNRAAANLGPEAECVKFCAVKTRAQREFGRRKLETRANRHRRGLGFDWHAKRQARR